MTADRPESRPARLEGPRWRVEAARKLIHIGTIGVPVLVWFLPRWAALALLGLAVAAALTVEWARAEMRWARYQFLARTRRLLRPRERRGLAGATYMALGYFFALLFFPRGVAVTVMLYNGVGDAAAALVGKRWGRHRAHWGKTWEGAAAGLLANLAVGMIIPGIAVPAAIVGAVAATLLEFLPLPLDDNLRITLGGGLVLWVAVVLASGGL